MSRIIRILSEAEKEKLGRSSPHAGRKDSRTPSASGSGHKGKPRAGAVPGHGDVTKTADNVLEEIERIREELLQIQEEEREILRKLRDMVGKVRKPTK
ncbi:MAG: hypothetical protein C4532_15335 [Candidatus Abyssobacteria bacterium SURF_17]|jgi:hypothetical protein|uniref:Uncharacterized protein n=1 Tax=Candidatus Abyssobacteria bacterium SURF_17 TaxID=2093361 RepID=A0A419ET51_9BACT|nr:MAG: hypothetical protein C4532_15335 [Candidatus Abyssubacteria bacterium SURF_17]